ncbi:ABC transporter substrate-binding protein [Halomarina oriensis]|uniref:ABC transporter substrate-binding protein n=1 Tax=Halomarina oriensis TaxID=671145 RepID=A0A6B0GIF5_9EURY|nr:ABC transporter substrate-binding protein [Halomarina oriensis]MWG33229.1 ABC transporter substrate-binding protein [Halomarina oriensis]
MDDDTDGRAPTRREYLTHGGAVLAGGLLAGCAGDTDGAGATTDGGDGDTATSTLAASTGEPTPAPETEQSSGERSYSVTMSPMGEVEFESVPETVFTRLTHHAGMAFALGRGDAVNAMHAPDYYDALWNQFTPRLDGVELDWTGLYSSWQVDEEHLYELDSDVHLADPASVAALDGWGRSDVEEIAENVGPWFGNTFSDRNQSPPEGWREGYEYYTLWEQFEKVARVFRERERYEALAAVHDDLLAAIETDLPPESERPTVAMVGASDVESIYPYNVNAPGFLAAHTRPFGVTDAFDENLSSGDTVDLEGMLAADPDVLLVLGGMHPRRAMAETRRALEDHPVGSDLRAVEDGRVYAQGARYQGPVLNLFQLEMTAKQLFPERFGEWPQYDSGPYPELPADERLFDHRRVADVVAGRF